MIAQLIEILRIQELSRIIEKELDLDLEIKEILSLNIKTIESSNKKEKEIELKQNQKIFNQSLISKSEENLQFNYIKSNATSAKPSTSLSLKTTYQSLIKRRTRSIQEICLTIEKTNIISQKVNKIKRIKKQLMR